MAVRSPPLPPPPSPDWTQPGAGQQRKISSGKNKKIGTQLPELVFPKTEDERSKAKVFRFLKQPSLSSPMPSPPPWMMTPPDADSSCETYPPPPPPTGTPNPSRVPKQLPPSPDWLPPYPQQSTTGYQSPTRADFLSPTGSTQGPPTPTRPKRPIMAPTPRSTSPPEIPPHIRLVGAATQPATASPQPERRSDGAPRPASGASSEPPAKDPFIGSGNVVKLSGDNFHTFINGKDLAMVMFYHTLDDKSAVSKVHFKKAADAKKDEHQFAAVDCHEDSQLCKSQDVTMVPVFKLFSWGTPVGTIRDTSKFDQNAINQYIDTLTSMGEPQKHMRTSGGQALSDPQECSVAKRLGFKK